MYYGLAIDRNMAAAKLKTRIMSALVSTASKACVPVTHQQPLTETTGKKKKNPKNQQLIVLSSYAKHGNTQTPGCTRGGK